eukprot:scaffold791_cov115-Cylindrotheca_fusiformis.AAC.3
MMTYPRLVDSPKDRFLRDGDSCGSLPELRSTGANFNRETSAFNQNQEEGLLLFRKGGTLQVDESAFSCCKSLGKLPEGLRVVELQSFLGCESLTTVRIPSSVIKIGDFAFALCQSLTAVDLPPGLLVIGSHCFCGCDSIETLEIPSTTTTIGESAFGICLGLESIKLPATLEILERYVLSTCRSLKHIEIPETVKTIADRAFYGCRSLSHVRIPPSVNNIGQSAFAECSSLISIELPEGVTFGEDDGTSGFSIFYCSSLVNVALPTTKRTLLALPTLAADLDIGAPEILQGLMFHSVVSGLDELEFNLNHRFDDLPLHKLCYYQSYCSTDDARAKFQSLMADDPLAATSEIDDFGMTPLHILSLSQTPNLSLLIAAIKGGDLDQIVWDWDLFGYASMDYLCLNKMPNSQKMIQSLLEATIVKRFDWLGLERWKLDVLQAVDDALAADWSSRRKEIGVVYFKLANYERNEILSLLELYLWKLKIDEVGATESADRLCCRINSGASIVVDNVIPFLENLDMEDYFYSDS